MTCVAILCIDNRISTPDRPKYEAGSITNMRHRSKTGVKTGKLRSRYRAGYYAYHVG